MRQPTIDDQQLVDRLAEVFRRHGYEGASLSLISEATGLKRASLYHRFPEGKQQMVEAVMSRTDERFADHVLEPLLSQGDPHDRVAEMARRLDRHYAGGTLPCLLDTLTVGDNGSGIDGHIRRTFDFWISAMKQVSRDAGLSTAQAGRRSERAMVLIQGGLIVSRISGGGQAFKRLLKELPDVLTAP